jgi:hypothetical protein
MEEPKKTPLASGLIGRKSGSIHGQLEISLINYDTIKIAIWRKAFCGQPDIEFSIPANCFQDMMAILDEAEKKNDNYYWMSRGIVKTEA